MKASSRYLLKPVLISSLLKTAWTTFYLQKPPVGSINEEYIHPIYAVDLLNIKSTNTLRHRYVHHG